MSKKKKYLTKYVNCSKRKCFIPFSGNGINICRGYELGCIREDKDSDNLHPKDEEVKK